MVENIFKIALKNWGESTSTHGIPNITKAQSKIIRILWILCFLVSLSYCTYQIIISIIGYLNFSVISNYQLLFEVPTLFPTIDICHLNPYGNFFDDFMSTLNKSNSSSKSYYIQDVNSFTRKMNTVFEKMNENDSFGLYWNPLWLENFLLSCQFNNQPCYNTNFSYFHNFYYGNCYSFNVGELTNVSANYNYIPFASAKRDLFTTKQAGAQFGLQLELYAGDPVNFIKYTYFNGFKIVIRNISTESIPEEMGIDLSPGFQTNIAVSRLSISHLPLPYNDCIDVLTDKNFERNKIFTILKNKMNKTNYNQAYCLKVCTQLYILENCGCFDFSLPKIFYSEATGCYTDLQFSCIDSKKTTLFNDFKNICNINCPIECEQQTFSTEISLSDYPSVWYANTLINSSLFLNSTVYQWNPANSEWNYDLLKKSLLKINVYYKDLAYTKIIETPALTIDSIIAFIGGNLGLFLGMSLLTLIEAIDFLFYIVHYRITQKNIDTNKVKDFNYGISILN